MREKFAEAFGNKFGFKDFEKMSRQNIEMFERAMRMFSPFGPNMGGWDKPMANPFAAFTGAGSDANGNASPSGAGSGSPASTQRDQEIRELKEQLAAMRQQIADLAQRK
jgi:polyhydroxyalkanoate synthesis regulator protein